MNRPGSTTEEDVLAGYRHGCEISPDLTFGAASLLVAMLAAAAARDKGELDLLLTEIEQITRFWAYQIFADEKVH